MFEIFKGIISGKIPSYKVAEDDDYLAFLDINPLAQGHTLAISKSCDCDSVFDFSDDQYVGLMLFSKNVACAMKKGLICKRVGLVIAGFEINYAHVHLLPIDSSDEIDFTREPIRLTQEKMYELSLKIMSQYDLMQNSSN